MKKILVTIPLLLLLAFTTANAQQKTAKKSATATMPDSAKMMKAWADYMTPGHYHEMFAKDVGTWNEEVTMWMDPSAPPTKSTSTAVNTMIMGGRYQQSQHTGTVNGMPFEGLSTLGYDNARKMFVTTWVDNMGTGIMSMEGKWDDATKSVIFKGKSFDPMTGKNMDLKQVFKQIDNDNQLVQMFDVTGGKEVKTMEIKLTRKV